MYQEVAAEMMTKYYRAALGVGQTDPCLGVIEAPTDLMRYLRQQIGLF